MQQISSFYFSLGSFSLALSLESKNRICCFDRTAARLEWSSFCEEERRAKKRERKAEIAAIKTIKNAFDIVKTAQT